MNIKNEVLKNEMSQYVSGLTRGYFITVDSALTTLANNITQETLYQFSEQTMRHICKTLNDYCYGRSFQRGERKLRIVSAIEIGSVTQRLHAHLIVLHQDECNRAAEQVENRLRTVCSCALRMSGSNAVEVKAFDRTQNWSGYFVKSTPFMHSKYGFMNIDFY